MKKRPDGLQTVCKSCRKEYDKKRYEDNISYFKENREAVKKKNREWYNEYKKTLSCEKCGEDRWYLLDFHHINPNEKELAIASAISTSIDAVKKEIEKCIPLCSNCHREFHFLEKENSLLLEDYISASVV